jgi:hypothetical protein
MKKHIYQRPETKIFEINSFLAQTQSALLDCSEADIGSCSQNVGAFCNSSADTLDVLFFLEGSDSTTTPNCTVSVQGTILTGSVLPTTFVGSCTGGAVFQQVNDIASCGSLTGVTVSCDGWVNIDASPNCPITDVTPA